MQITNNNSLPDTFRLALENDDYSKGDADFSVSDLINPVQQTVLKCRYWEQLSEDVADAIWKLAGKAMHHILESAKDKNALQEERLFVEIEGKRVSGCFDHFNGHTLSDYKFTSAWTRVYESRQDSWKKQLNLYRMLLESHGFKVESLRIIAIYRDWRRSEAMRSNTYPQQKAESIKIELQPLDAIKAYAAERVKAITEANDKVDNELPPCTPEEMWAHDDSWIVIKPGAKKASKVCTTKEESEAWKSQQKKPDDFGVQLRPGERVRCRFYCPVRDHCSQFQDYEVKNAEKENEDAE